MSKKQWNTIIKRGTIGMSYRGGIDPPPAYDVLITKMTMPLHNEPAIEGEQSDRAKFLDMIERVYDQEGIEYSFEDLDLFRRADYSCEYCKDSLSDFIGAPVIKHGYSLCCNCADNVIECPECGDLCQPGYTTSMCDDCYEDITRDAEEMEKERKRHEEDGISSSTLVEA